MKPLLGIGFFTLCLTLVACTPATSTLSATAPVATEAPFFAPDFTMTSLDRDTITLTDLRDRWVIVNFWATWCIPCVEEMPALQQLANEEAESLVVLGINVRETQEQVSAFRDRLQLRFPLLINPPDDVLLTYSVIGLPQTLLIAPGGVVVERSFGPVDVNALQAYMGN